jgi:hypothetical protein
MHLHTKLIFPYLITDPKSNGMSQDRDTARMANQLNGINNIQTPSDDEKT